MEEVSGFHITVIGIIVLLFDLHSKSEMNYIIKNGYSTIGLIKKYETKFVRVGGEWTWLDYPLVSYIGKYGQQLTGFIKYATSSKRPFSIGQEVEIIIYDGIIYYKHAINNGLKIISLALIFGGIGLEMYKYWFK